MSDVKLYMNKYLREGLEKVAYTKEEAAALADAVSQAYDALELDKQASFSGTVAGEAAKGIGKALGEKGTALGLGLATGLGLMGAQRIFSATVDKPMQRSKFNAAVEQAIAKNQILQHAEKSKVMAIAETIFRYAPNAAADANLLSSILSNAVMMDGIDPGVVQSLLNLEKTYRDANKSSFMDIIAKG